MEALGPLRVTHLTPVASPPVPGNTPPPSLPALTSGSQGSPGWLREGHGKQVTAASSETLSWCRWHHVMDTWHTPDFYGAPERVPRWCHLCPAASSSFSGDVPLPPEGLTLLHPPRMIAKQADPLLGIGVSLAEEGKEGVWFGPKVEGGAVWCGGVGPASLSCVTTSGLMGGAAGSEPASHQGRGKGSDFTPMFGGPEG